MEIVEKAKQAAGRAANELREFGKMHNPEYAANQFYIRHFGAEDPLVPLLKKYGEQDVSAMPYQIQKMKNLKDGFIGSGNPAKLLDQINKPKNYKPDPSIFEPEDEVDKLYAEQAPEFMKQLSDGNYHQALITAREIREENRRKGFADYIPASFFANLLEKENLYRNAYMEDNKEK